MSKRIIAIGFGAVLSTGLLFPVCAVEMPNTRRAEKLNPFTHQAQAPEGTDLKSIRLEKARPVMVPTTITYGTNVRYCEEASYRDPGGSAYCPSARSTSRAAAYELTYSFAVPASLSEESGQRHATFRVYFRPEELAPEIRAALSSHEQDRADIAAYFVVNASQESVERLVVDGAHSSFCEGSFIEGNWTQSDSRCLQNVAYRTIASPSSYLTLTVEATTQAREPKQILTAASTTRSAELRSR